MNDAHEVFIKKAIALAQRGAISGRNGPFGALVVKNGVIISEGSNRVTSNNDPTAHAEIVAIRRACNQLGTFQLDECIIYSSCEPCPMCLGAIYWARPIMLFYASTKEDAAASGFDDAFIYKEFEIVPANRKIPMHYLPKPEAIEVFTQWKNNPNKIDY